LAFPDRADGHLYLLLEPEQLEHRSINRLTELKKMCRLSNRAKATATCSMAVHSVLNGEGEAIQLLTAHCQQRRSEFQLSHDQSLTPISFFRVRHRDREYASLAR
jgi:hypothetical protein